MIFEKLKSLNMKNSWYLLLTIVLLSSCKKNNLSPVGAGKSRFSFTVSGATSGTFNSDDRLSTALAGSGGYSNISASKVNITTLTTEMAMMLMPSTVTVKKYALGSMPSSEVVPTFSYTKGSTGWATSPGATDFTIEVTKVDGGLVEGKLSGKLGNDTDHTEVTINGTFSYKL